MTLGLGEDDQADRTSRIAPQTRPREFLRWAPAPSLTQGLAQINNLRRRASEERGDATQKAFRDAGAELKEFYLVMGRYDAVAIVEAPA